MRRNLHGIALLLFTSSIGCHETRSVNLPEAPEGTQSAIVAVDPPGSGISVSAFSWPAGKPRFASLTKEAAVTIMYYTAALDTFGLEPGPLENAAGAPMVRPLPLAPSMFVSELNGEGLLESWTALEEITGELADFRIAGGNAIDCALSGGCFVDDDARTMNACTVPCPTPEAVTEPTEPMPPAPPMLTPCPTGWVETPIDDLTVCEPPARTCNGDQLIDQTQCDGVSSACEANGWPSSVPNDRPVLYVDENAMGVGVGTMMAPYTTITEALANAPATVVLAIRRGNYAPAGLTIDGDVEIIGGCAAETQIDLAANVMRLDAAGSVLRVRDVTIRGGRPAVEIGANHTLEATDTVFEQSGTAGTPVLPVSGGTLMLQRVVFDRPAGTAVSAVGGTVTAGYVTISDGGGAGFDLSQGVMATISDTVVENVADHALAIAAQADVTASRCLFDQATDDTIDVDTATVRLDQVVVRDGRAQNMRDGRALHLNDGAEGTVARSFFTRTDTSGVRLDSSTLTMSDTVIRDTREVPADGEHGMALAVLSNSDATLERVDFADTLRTGINVGGASTIRGDDVRIRRVKRGVAENLGVGFAVFAAANAIVDRMTIEGAATVGMQLDTNSLTTCENVPDRTGRLAFTDIVVTEDATAKPQFGIEINCRAQPTFQRVLVRGASLVGVDLDDSANAMINDLRVDDIGSRGIDLYDDAELHGARAHVTNAGRLVFADFRGKVFLDHALLDCIPAGARDGIGANQRNFGEIHLDVFEVRNCETAFRLNAQPPLVELEDGTIRDNETALETNFEAKDFMVRVQFLNNDQLIVPNETGN